MTGRTRVMLALAGVITIAATATVAHLVLRTREASLPPAPATRVPANWQSFRSGEGHVVHVQQAGIACEGCHGASSTMTTPSLTVCAGCHQGQATMRHGLDSALAVGAAHGAELADCLACHGFSESAAQTPWQCLRCHEEPQGAHAAIPHGAHQDCSTCHRPHDEPAIQPKACRDCHVDADNQHGGLSTEDGKNCLTCHDAHGSAALANQRCADCHAQPEAIFAGHERCAGCHVPHAFSKDEAASCTSCHREQHTLGEKTSEAHRRCTSCHDPHAPKRASDATCKGCHAKVAPSHPAVEGHDCLSCHAPHAQHPQRATGTHGATNMPVATTTHGTSDTRVATHVACTQCHALAPDDRGAHGGKADCTTCHAPHAFAHPAQPTVCAACHATQLAALAKNAGHGKPPAQAGRGGGRAPDVAHAGGAPCASCHQGHPHAASMPPVACASCHADVHPRQEHAQCSACHEPHSGAPLSQAASCQTCHAEEHAAAIPAHRECARCHEPHQGKTRAPASCRSCHAQQAKLGHGKLEAGCAQCHGVHAGSAGGSHATTPPLTVGAGKMKTCTQCHAVAKLGGMHQVKQHQTCDTCHEGAHDPGPWSERETCIGCHRDREQHAPQAALCQGCHVFKP